MIWNKIQDFVWLFVFKIQKKKNKTDFAGNDCLKIFLNNFYFVFPI